MASEEEKRRKREEKEAKRIQDEKDWEAINKRQQKINEKRREDAIKRAADQEAMERIEDDYLNRQFLSEFGIDARLAREYMEIAAQVELNDEEAMKAFEAYQQAQKAQKGGIIFGPNPEKAGKIIRKNRGIIKRTIEKGKKKKNSCLGALAIMAGATVATLYSAYEVTYAVASALF